MIMSSFFSLRNGRNVVLENGEEGIIVHWSVLNIPQHVIAA